MYIKESGIKLDKRVKPDTWDVSMMSEFDLSERSEKCRSSGINLGSNIRAVLMVNLRFRRAKKPVERVLDILFLCAAPLERWCVRVTRVV